MITVKIGPENPSGESFKPVSKVKPVMKKPILSKAKSAAPGTLPTTSGLQNSLLVNQVNSIVDGLYEQVKSVENSSELLYKALVDAIERNATRAGARREATGVHFIESGEVLVIGQGYSPNTRLNVNDAFGMCEILRKTGPEYLGDLRAGIKQVKTFYFKYEDIRKRLSIPEKIALQTMECMQDRLEGVIQYVASKEGISCDKLRKF